MLKWDGETNNNLFIHCDGVRWLWNNILTYSHIEWVLPRRIEDICWHGGENFVMKTASLYGILSPDSLYGSTRNDRCFEDQTWTMEQIRKLFYLCILGLMSRLLIL